MSRMRNFVVLGAAALALSAGGCTKSQNHNEAGRSAPRIEAVKAAIEADQSRWNDEYHAKPKSAQQLASHYASDAYLVQPSANPISGTRNIRSLFDTLAADPSFQMTLDSEKIEASGDLAYVRGRFSARFNDPRTKQARTAQGTFLTIYQEQDDGSWKVIEDFTASDVIPMAALK